MPARSPSAERKRRYRQRQRDGQRIYPAPIPDQVIETAINAGWLSDEDSHDRAKVGEFLSRIAAEWAKRWQDHFFGTRTHSTPAANGNVGAQPTECPE